MRENERSIHRLADPRSLYRIAWQDQLVSACILNEYLKYGIPANIVPKENRLEK